MVGGSPRYGFERTHEHSQAGRLAGETLGFGLLPDAEAAMLAAFADGDDGITVHDVTRPTCPVVWVSRQFCRITGWLPEQVLAGGGSLAGAETDPVLQEQLDRAIREGRAAEATLLHHTQDDRVWWDRVRVRPVTGPDGTVHRVVVLHRDLGPDLERDRLLEEQRRFLRFIEDCGAIGLLRIDAAANIRQINAAFSRLYGWQPEELVGHPLLELLPPADHAAARRRLSDALTGRVSSDVREWRFLTRTGEVRTVTINAIAPETIAGPIASREVTPVSVAMLVTDVTHHKHVQRALSDARDAAQVASRAKSTFLANVSHELRTPLNAILGFSEIMAHGLLGQINIPRYAEYVVDIHRAASHLLEIINNLLDISKIEAGRMELREGSVDLLEAARESLAIVEPRFEASGLELVYNPPDALPPLRADATRIRQMLVNLLSNAAKFTAPDGCVTLTVWLDPVGRLGIEIGDTGVGMDPDEIATALEPFGQVENGLGRAAQGTGLGLPLTRALAEQHGAELSIDSAKGAGTRVTILFPAARTMV